MATDMPRLVLDPALTSAKRATFGLRLFNENRIAGEIQCNKPGSSGISNAIRSRLARFC